MLLFRGLPRRFCKNCTQRQVKRQSLRFVLCGDDLIKNLYSKSALFKVISSKKDFLNHLKKPFQALPQVRQAKVSFKKLFKKFNFKKPFILNF